MSKKMGLQALIIFDIMRPMDIREIIKQCGGAPHIADELERLAKADPLRYRIAGVKAIYKWADNGIPERHWRLVMGLSGVSEREIFLANRALEEKTSADKANGVPRRSHSRVAA